MDGVDSDMVKPPDGIRARRAFAVLTHSPLEGDTGANRIFAEILLSPIGRLRVTSVKAETTSAETRRRRMNDLPKRGGLEPPHTTIVLGKTGVGKSTTLNALGSCRLATDPVLACTTAPAVIELCREALADLNRDRHHLVDLPGTGESIQADLRYRLHYEHWARRAHRVLYITQADTRAYKQDQLFLARLVPLFDPGVHFVLAVNQVDRLHCDEMPDPDRPWTEPTPSQSG